MVGGAGSSIQSAHCTVHYTRAGILCSSALDDLKHGITTATAGVDEDMLTCVWQEFDYRIDICRVTKGGHIEHL
jgi:hypothetical protein